MGEGSGVRLVLCMSVKDAAATLGRSLASALPHVDGYVICDAESSDGTLERIEGLARSYGVPGQLERHDWRGPGANRTLSVAAGRAWIADRGWPGRQTYLLSLKADAVLHVEPGFDRDSLDGESYELVRDDGQTRCREARLLCASRDWRCVGSSPESWDATDRGKARPLPDIWIEQLSEPEAAARELERETLALRQRLREQPDEPRHTFDLAQALFSASRWEDAAGWYDRSLKHDGSAEQRWYARYRHGLCLLRLGESERGAGVLLQAFEERPTRAEPLYDLACHYRERAKYHAAAMLARRALEIDYPATDTLYVAKQVYDWRVWEELMITACYGGVAFREQGFRACEQLRAQRDHEAWLPNYVARDELRYVSSLDGLRRGTFGISREARELATAGRREFGCGAPSIVRAKKRTFVGLPLADGAEVCLVVLVWDSDTGRTDDDIVVRNLPGHIDGFHLVMHEDRVWFGARHGEQPGLIIGRLSEGLDQVEQISPIDVYGAPGEQDGYVLWSREESLCAVAAYDPLMVWALSTDAGMASVASIQIPPFDLSSARASTPPLRIPGREERWITLVHEARQNARQRVNVHRWLELDERSGVVRYSRPFTFEKLGAERAAGLCAIDDERVVVTYANDDGEARWIELGWRDVLDRLDKGTNRTCS